ncbi:MAG: cysteine desulfurase family protein [Pseudomonadota bacterium]
MRGDRVYLDWNATAPLRPEARQAMLEAMDVVGNPSSVHTEGRAAKACVERARAQISQLLACDPSDLVFTSGATEGAALALSSFSAIYGSAAEHDAVAAWVQDPSQMLDIGPDGVLTGTYGGQPFSQTVREGVIAFQAANSETGILQPTLQFAQEIWSLERSVLILVDAVQALGKMDFDVPRSGADLLLASAHKLGGPKGVGTLYVKPGVALDPKIKGGGQEMGRRSGTENVIGIAGFGAAAEAAARDLADGVWERVAKLRNILEISLDAAAKDIIFVGNKAGRLPNTSCFAVPGWKSETQVMQMDLAGFAISAGSACSSGKVKASRVLKAMGFDDRTAASAVRVSLGPTTTEEEVLRFADAWIAAYRRHKKRAGEAA